MKTRLSPLAARTILAASLIHGAHSISLATGHTEHLDYNDGTILGYLSYLPPDYETTTDLLPLILFFHGSGERAADGIPNLERLLGTGLPEILLTQDIPFIVISPQVRYTWNGTHNEIDSFLDYLLESFPRIDRNRIYLTGISDGGKGVFDYPLYFRERIAAIVPISTWPSDANSVPISKKPYLESPPLPVWGFHGSEDGYGSMQVWIDDLKEAGGIAQMQLLSGGHSETVWNTIYAGGQYDIYSWLLDHELDPTDFPKWSDWRVRYNWVNTSERSPTLGWLYVESAPWVYSYSFNRYLYIDETSVSDAGGWSYVTK